MAGVSKKRAELEAAPAVAAFTRFVCRFTNAKVGMLLRPEGERKVKVKMYVFDIVLILRFITVAIVYKYMHIY